MDDYLPPAPASFALKPPPPTKLQPPPIPKDWPHAPVHRLNDNAVYMVTAAMLHKQKLFDTPAKLDLIERFLLSYAGQCGWRLEAWAVLGNHYHFVARGAVGSIPMRQFLREWHSWLGG